MAVCRLRAGGISLCSTVFDIMIIGCTKQLCRDLISRMWFLNCDLQLIYYCFFPLLWLSPLFDLDQKGDRMFRSMMSVMTFSMSDNITHSTTLVTALDNVTTLSLMTTHVINDTNITVPHKCLLLLYEDIGKSRWVGGNGTKVWPWTKGESFVCFSVWLSWYQGWCLLF